MAIMIRVPLNIQSISSKPLCRQSDALQQRQIAESTRWLRVSCFAPPVKHAHLLRSFAKMAWDFSLIRDTILNISSKEVFAV